MRGNQKGISVVNVPLKVVIVIVIGVIGWIVMSRTIFKENKSVIVSTPDKMAVEQARLDLAAMPAANVLWSFDGEQWYAKEPAPACTEPAQIPLPVPAPLIYGFVMPGQTWEGMYLTEGKFLFVKQGENEVPVKVPTDSVVIRGARYLNGGEPQYTFDFVTNCGIMYRMDHMLVLEPKYQAIADTLAPATEGNDAVQWLQKPIEVKKGEAIAKSVGTISKGAAPFLDFGIFDLRSKNKNLANPDWVAAHESDKELSHYMRCTYDYLEVTEGDFVESLRSRIASAQSSDICQ